MAKMEDAFNGFYNEFKDWTKEEILHRTFDIILESTEKDMEINRLNNIITELEKYLIEDNYKNEDVWCITTQEVLKKIKELKESSK